MEKSIDRTLSADLECIPHAASPAVARVMRHLACATSVLLGCADRTPDASSPASPGECVLWIDPSNVVRPTDALKQLLEEHPTPGCRGLAEDTDEQKAFVIPPDAI